MEYHKFLLRMPKPLFEALVADSDKRGLSVNDWILLKLLGGKQPKEGKMT